MWKIYILIIAPTPATTETKDKGIAYSFRE